MSATSHRILDTGPVETRVKLVLEALITTKWALMVETETGNWLVYTHGDQSVPSIGIPDDIIRYLVAQGLLTGENPSRYLS